jgi:arabinofuranosyltransferase
MAKLFPLNNIPKIYYLILAICLFLGGTYLFLPFFSDDSLITLRYSRRLVDLQQLTWSDGKAVEGYTNFLWLLLCSALYFLNVDLVIAARVIGILCTVGILFAFYAHADKKSNTAFALTIFLLALSAPLQVWAIGGLEQPLYAMLLSWGIYFFFQFKERNHAVRPLLLSSFFFGLMALTRPDGLLFPFVIVFISVVFDFFKNKKITFTYLILLIFPVLFATLQMAFRLSYYGEWVPNTAYVKIHLSFERLVSGLRYLIAGSLNQFPFSLIVFLIIAFAIKYRIKSFRLLLLTSLLAAWGGYLIFIGGDIFPAYRHFLVLIVIAAYMLLDFSPVVLEKINTKVTPAYYIPLICIVFVLHQFYTPSASSETKRALQEEWEWRGKEIGEFLKFHYKNTNPTIAVTAAGCIPFWSELNALDLLGLNDYDLPRKYARNEDIHFVGHDLGSPLFIYDKKPDIICFSMGEDGGVFGYTGIEKDSLFQQLYHAATFKIPSELADFSKENSSLTMYLLKGSPRLGIRETTGSIQIPAAFFSNVHTPVFENKQGQLICTILPGKNHTFMLELANRTLINAYSGTTDEGLQYKLKPAGSLTIVSLTNTGSSAINTALVEVPVPSTLLSESSL